MSPTSSRPRPSGARLIPAGRPPGLVPILAAGLVAVLAAVVVHEPAAHAHAPSTAYFTFTPPSPASPGGGDARLELALRDLDDLLDLDADGDGALTRGELRARAGGVAAYVLGHLRVRTPAGPCAPAAAPRAGSLAVVERSDGAYAAVTLALGCPPAAALEIDDDLLFELDPQHRALARVDGPAHAPGAPGAAPLLFTAQARRQTIAWSPASSANTAAGPAAPLPILFVASFRAFVREGVRHIWGGVDHLLFLMALLLPSVVRRARGVWVPVAAIRPALADVLRTVTAFTAAHSLTLSLAALEAVRLPSRLTEAAIAASVVLAAANNLVPLFGRDRWVVAFALGLLHGFGFSSVLTDLGLPLAGLAPSLLGFNLGVELGQLAVVAAFVPAAYLLRRTALYRRLTLPGGSAAVALVAAIWLIERALDLPLLPGSSS